MEDPAVVVGGMLGDMEEFSVGGDAADTVEDPPFSNL